MFVINANQQSYLPKVLNQDSSVYQTAYPKSDFAGYVGAASGQTNYGTVNTDLTQNISDHTVYETVGSTQINGYFRTVVDIFENIGNYFANADYGTQTEMGIGYTGFAYNGLTAATRAFSKTMRFASLETLSAGKSVGATCQFAPSFKGLCNGPNPSNITWSNVVATIVFKLMNTAGTLTTIGTMTTTAVTFTSANNAPGYYMAALKTSTFTPQTSSAGDRIIAEVTLTGSVVIPAGTGGSGGSNGTLFLALGFGFEGSKRQLMLDYQAARPFQISIT